MADVASQTFDFVGRELNATLAEARTALESYVEQPLNFALLERCARELHQVQGVLRVLEIYGAALLAEEMEHVARYLLATATERKSQAESLDALMRAMVQLPSYLERVLAGGRDLALVLLPLLNDLRAVRGSSLLSEGTLLLLNLKSDKQAQPIPVGPGELPLTVEQWGRRLRTRFQVGLIGWIRGERVEQNLEILAAVSSKLEQIATHQPVFQLWWVVGAVIEALQEGALEGGVSIKRLLGLADREIKRLYEEGESRYTQSPPVELLNNLLYYVGRTETTGPRAVAVRASFRLSELLPVDENIEEERENLSAPSVKLMQTVAAAIREDLSKVKDVLDIFVRRGSGQPRELGSQAALLRKIADTLGVLGLGELRTNIMRETQRLDKIVSGELKPEEPLLVEIAATLIGVEDKLDDQLVGMILPKSAVPGRDEDAEFQQVQSAVLRECILNLARIKEAVTQAVVGAIDAAGLDSWQEMMRGLKAGLLMLGKTRAVEIIEAIGVQLRRVMQPGGRAMTLGSLDRLADSIVSVEYYMETLQSGRSDPWYMLDNAESSLRALESEPTPPVPTVEALAPGSFARTVQLARAGEEPQTPQVNLTGTHPVLPILPAREPASVAFAETADPELLKLFIEEAREELQKISRYFHDWEQNPLDREALATMRRSFHTLKGSGRMVGARELAEFAWSIENLVNRLLDNTLTRTQPIVATLNSAVMTLPQLIDQLETGQAQAHDGPSILARANALAANQGEMPAAAAAPAEEPPEQPSVVQAPSAAAPETEPAAAPAVAPQIPEPVAFGADAVLADIYARETSAHVSAVRAYLERESSASPPHVLPEEIYRAVHTLSGSSNMAEARHGIRLAQPLDQWLRKAFDSALGLESGDLILLADAMVAMESVASNLDESTGFFLSHESLLRRIAHAHAALDRRIADAAHAARAAQQAQPPAEAVAQFDPEIASIFTEEATELLESAEAAIAAWREDPESAESRTALKRPLHTLKGGARMAGIQPMGDLSHELESLVLQIDQGTVAATPATFDVLQASIDELARMREAVAMGRGLSPARTAIERIQALSQAAPAPAAEESAPMIAEILESTAQLPVLVTEVPAAPQQAEAASLSEPQDAQVFAPEPQIAPVFAREPEAVAAFAPEAEAAPEAAAIPAESAPTVTEILESTVQTPAAVTEATAPDAAAGAINVTEVMAEVLASLAEISEPPPDLVHEAASDEGVPEIIEHIDAEVPSYEWTAAQLALPETTAPDLTSTADDATPPEAIVVEPPAATLPAPPLATPVAAQAPAAPSVAAEDILLPPQLVPPGREPVPPGDRPEMARVDAELLDHMLNTSGEVSIARARLEQQLGSIDFNLGELSRTVTRLKEQLRKLEIETETQILHGHEEKGGSHRGDFDPLELDRYSSIQQFSRALAETASDVASIQQLLETLTQEAQNLLTQQARTITELQNGLMRTRMVPFQRHVQRLARIVRQAASDSGKRAELVVEGAAGELDRQVLERMLPPFEHMLRNAVVHGIELPAERVARGKPETGRIRLELRREGAEVLVRLTDDGAGMNLRAIRDKGIALGLVGAEQALSDEDAMQLILEPGFSTAGFVTQQAGRGVGMDIVATEIKRLGGALNMESMPGEGTTFTIRLPFTLAISHALVVRTEQEYYALPLPTVEGVLRLPKAEVQAHLGPEAPVFESGGQKYRFQSLATFVGLEPAPLPEQDVTIPVVLVRAGEHSTALITDELIGSREIVVKSVGPQISAIRGISGATILGDGRIVTILDIGALVRSEWRARAQPLVARDRGDRRVFAMVVDDSITVRRVTQRLLERNGMRVLTARDGMDAVTLLQDHVPDIILLDIEMPRMDGYEVAAHVRNDPRLREVPIIMITSRSGEKHRARAIEIGVDDYLGKPYQEAQLLDAIAPLVERHRAAQSSRKLAEARVN
jgi:chemosensory pili system protein ChpA (sensor histidine kinase/response regulator)